MAASTTITTTTKSVRIVVLPSHSCRGHFTKFISKTVVQLNADVCWRSEWTAPSQLYDW